MNYWFQYIVRYTQVGSTVSTQYFYLSQLNKTRPSVAGYNKLSVIIYANSRLIKKDFKYKSLCLSIGIFTL